MDTSVDAGIARGRMRFNRGDFWGSHEAWEAAWHVAPPAERPILQGLIQAAAAFHKHVVQDNPAGARRLLAWATDKLDPVPDGHFRLALAAFRAHLHQWAARLADPPPAADGAIAGLPYLEWSPAAAARQIRLDAVRLYELNLGERRAVLVAAEADGRVGWGECRLAWETHGLWSSLVHTLAPAVLTEPIAVPSELRVVWSGLATNPCAEAGLEAALWDLWAQRRGVALAAALGIPARPVPLAAHVRGGTPEGLAASRDHLLAYGYRHLIIPARPNADRRVVPAVVAGSPAGALDSFAVDLGGAYRPSDFKTLQALDALGARWLGQPAPLARLADAVTLARWLATPVALGGWGTAPEVESAHALAALDAVLVDPGICGLTEAAEIAAFAAGRGVPAAVVSTAETAVGAAADLVLAAHAGITWPSAIAHVHAVGDGAAIRPGADGRAEPVDALGLGVRPTDAWLATVVTRHAVLQA